MATLDDILKRGRGKSQTGFDKERPVKPPQGRTTWRILPGWRDGEPNQFFHPYGQHFVKDMEGNIKAVLVCPERTFSKPCDVCDVISEAAKSTKDDEMREQILESRATQSFLMNAVQVEGGDGGVKVLSVGSTLFNSILDTLEEYGEDFLDPEKGNDIVITRDGAGKNTKYSMTVRSAAKSKPVQKSLLMARKDLDKYVSEDIEVKKAKALETLGGTFATLGITAGSSNLALTAPEADDDLDDDLPETTEEITEAAKHGKGKKKPKAEEVDDADVIEDDVPEKETADASFGADVEDEDLDELLAGI